MSKIYSTHCCVVIRDARSHDERWRATGVHYGYRTMDRLHPNVHPPLIHIAIPRPRICCSSCMSHCHSLCVSIDKRVIWRLYLVRALLYFPIPQKTHNSVHLASWAHIGFHDDSFRVTARNHLFGISGNDLQSLYARDARACC